METLEDKLIILTEIKSKIHFLKELSSQDLEVVVEDMTFKKYKENEVIIEQDSQGSVIFIVYNGKCRVSYRQTDSQDPIKQKKFVEVGVLKKGDCFGELGAIGNHKRNARVKALGDDTWIIGLKLNLNNSQGDAKLDAILAKVYKSLLVDVSKKISYINKKHHENLILPYLQ
ncbi:MAG: cyclic nucleotide-binding domain-containing protein [Campylobacterales bacterium]|nr:cyclic nucleotide-binding domain-containing protein [Campylobacterales bacterium]